MLTVHRGQEEAARWWATWAEAYAVGARARTIVLRDDGRGQWAPDEAVVRSMAMCGGRRSGKTDWAAKSGFMFSVLRPRSRVWMVSESLPKTEELELELLDLMPRDWYRHLGAPWFQFRLLNGSIITLRSAHDPEKLKRGRTDYAVLNEAQNMPKRAYVHVRAALADNAGLCVIAANPPDDAEGQWVADHVEETIAQRRSCKYFALDPRKNPYIDHSALEDMRGELDERTYAIEILGEFRPRTDVVMHAWSAARNVLPVPELGCITPAFLARYFPGRGATDVIGVDFQKYPYICGVTLDAFVADATDPRRRPRLWYTDVVLVEGNETEFDAALRARGYEPRTTILICDASGAWQNVERTKGAGSHDMLRELGWRLVFRPDSRMKANPNVVERCKVANGCYKAADGTRRVFSDPRLHELNQALLKWENRGGVPFRRSEYAHLCDSATYPLWRFFPRRMRPPKAEYVGSTGAAGAGTSRRKELEGI